MHFPPFHTKLPPPELLIQQVIVNGNQSGAFMLRLDKIHPVISGNKWLKLSGHLQQVSAPLKGVCSIGGPWSNHLHALAGWSLQAGIPCKIVVGARAKMQTAMLEDCAAWQAEIHWADTKLAEQTARSLASREDLLFVSMGGEGYAGETGVHSFFNHEFFLDFKHIHVAAGTATTAAGIAKALPESTVHALVPGLSVAAFELLTQTHRGVNNLIFYHQPSPRFGRHNSSLTNFMNNCFEQTGIETDCVYTARLLMHLWPQLVSVQHKMAGHLIVHTGGLQGNRSIAVGTLKF